MNVFELMLNVWFGCPATCAGGTFGPPGLGNSRGFFGSLLGGTWGLFAWGGTWGFNGLLVAGWGTGAC